MASPEPHAAPLFKKKKTKGRPGGLRKRSLSPSASTSASAQAEDPEPSAVVQTTRKQAANHLIQGTGGFKRRKQEQDDAALVSDDDEPETTDGFGVKYSSTTVRERRRSSSPPAEVSMNAPAVKVEVGADDGLYRGAAAQRNNVAKSFGPIKGGPSNVRTITLVDYQPDVCKDYKETGFCGFGDTCKFLHDRGDYLHGWQLDNSFLSSQAAAGSFMAKQRARDGADDGPDEADSDNEDLPFACLICRKPFGKEPVVTLCGHYFDSACAIKRYAKNTKCFACGKGTQGVFNKATKLIAKKKERDAIEAAAAAQEREFEEDDSDDGIVGLAEDPNHAPGGAETEEESGSEEEEEEAPRRRPIIEIH